MGSHRQSAGAISGPVVIGVWRRWRKRRECFHHDHSTGTTWITGQLINSGTGKMFTCANCQNTWFV